MYIKKSIELESFISSVPNTVFIKKIIFKDNKICLIVGNCLIIFQLLDNCEIEKIFEWKTSSEYEFILNGLCINKNLLILITNLSIYLFKIDDLFMVNEFKIPYFSKQNPINYIEIASLNKNTDRKDFSSITVLISFCSGLFFVSIFNHESEYFVKFGDLKKMNQIGKVFFCGSEQIIYVNNDFLYKFFLDLNNLSCSLYDFINIKEIMFKSTKEDFQLFSVNLISDTGKKSNKQIKLIFLKKNFDTNTQNILELYISNKTLLPVKILKFNFDNLSDLVDFTKVDIDEKTEIYLVTFRNKLEVWNFSDIKNVSFSVFFEDLNSSFSPYVISNIKESNILYISCCREESRKKWYINVIKLNQNPQNQVSDIQLNFECKNMNSAEENEQIKRQIDKFLFSENNKFKQINVLIELFKKLVTTSKEIDYEYIFEFVTKIPIFIFEEARNFYLSVLSILESINAGKCYISKMNDLIHKLTTFDILYKKSHKNFDMALKMCSNINIFVPKNEKKIFNSLWNAFITCDIGKLGICYLSLNLIEDFFFIFNRHSFDFGNSDKEKRNDLILESLNNLPILIPEKLEKEMPMWLVNQVFPLVINRDELLNWIADRAIVLEYISNGDVDRCIFLLSSVFQIDKLQSPMNNQILPKQIVKNGIFWAGCGDKRYAIRKTSSKINQVYWTLLECSDIKKKYNLEINFSSLYYCEITIKDIIYKLLSRISSFELVDEIKHNIIPFCNLRGIDVDKILLDYTVDLISSVNNKVNFYKKMNISNIEIKRNHYQSRIISLVNSISKDEYKTHVLLQYLSAHSKYFNMDRKNNSKFSSFIQSEFECFINFAKSLTLEEGQVSELKNRIALIDAQNLLSRYNLDHMASVVLFEKNAPRRLLTHVISQIDAGIESFKDALSLLNYLKQETNIYFMSITEAFCLRLRFILFKKTRILTWTKNDGKRQELSKSLENEILELFSLLESKKKFIITQQFVCFIWQFLDFYTRDSNLNLRIKSKCEIATHSAIVILRHFLKFAQDSDLKAEQTTFWASNESFNTFLRLQALQLEFNIFLKPSDIMVNKINYNELSSSSNFSFATFDLDPFSSFKILSNPFEKNTDNFFGTQENSSFKNWEWDSSYFHTYNESCYSRLCEIFDEYSGIFIEMNDSLKTNKGRLTKLLRLGNLIGVEESYVRRSLIRHSITKGGKFCFFKKLIQELVKSPSPKNVITIIDDVQNIILSLCSNLNIGFGLNNNKSVHFGDITPLELVFIISKLLQILATSIIFCPITMISFVIALSGDILWVHDFLIQASDTIDIPKYSSSSLIIDLNDQHIFTKSLLSLFPNKDRKNLLFNLKKCYYKEICTLCPSSNAIKLALKFLSNKILTRKELSKQILIKKTYIPSFILFNFYTEPGWWSINNESSVDCCVSNSMENLKLHINDLMQQLYQLECLSLAMSIYLRHPALITDFSLVLKLNMDFFRKVLKGKDPMDGQLCMALSSTLEKKDSWNIFVQSLIPSNILDNYYRAQRMARIGWDLGILYNHYSMRKEMEELHKQSKWCNYFRRIGIDFDQSLFFQKQEPQDITYNKYKKSIVPKLIFKSGFDLPSSLQYAKDYNINEEYIISLWCEKMILCYFNEEFECKMQNILPFITHELGKEIFENTFSHIISYDYERLLFVLNWYYSKIQEIENKNFEIYARKEINEISSVATSSDVNQIGNNNFLTNSSIASKIEILKILSIHKRISKVDIEEKDFVEDEIKRLCEEDIENRDILIKEKIQNQYNYRLPFHYLINCPLKVLKYEINDETIYKIKRLSDYLGIERIIIDIQFVWNIVVCRKYRFYLENSFHDKLKVYSQKFREYYSILIENDKILLRYIESIASFDLESGIAIVILIIDELPLSITKIKLIEWCEAKSEKLKKINLNKGYPSIEIEGIEYSKQREIIDNIPDFLKSKKSLISTMLILERHNLEKIFGKLIEFTKDVFYFINTLYYYVTPLISEGFYWNFCENIQKSVYQKFCIDDFVKKKELDMPNYNDSITKYTGIQSINDPVEKFNIFLENIATAYYVDIRKIRINIIKNLLNKPFETPFEILKNKFSNVNEEIFETIENSGITKGLDHWFNLKNTFHSRFYMKLYIDRIAFVCGGISLNDSILLLLSISFKNSTNYSYMTKCNALKTLFQIASTKNIKKRYPKYDDLQIIWLHNYYMIFFHELHIPQDFSKFYLSEKSGLAKSLWREYNNRKMSFDSYFSKTRYIDSYEEYGVFSSLKETRGVNSKIRCVYDETENRYLQTKSSVNKIHINNPSIEEINNVLYLIAEMCIDFKIYDSRLFSEIIKNLYLQLKSEIEVKLLCDILFAAYNNGYIYNLSLNTLVFNTWKLLIIDPLLILRNDIENCLIQVWRKECFKKNIFENIVYDIELFFRTSHQYQLISFFSQIYDRCPITPFIEIEEIINVTVELIESLMELNSCIKNYYENSNKSDFNENNNLILVNYTKNFFFTIYNKISKFEFNKFNELEKYFDSLDFVDYNNISNLLEINQFKILSIIIKPIDLYLFIYSSNKNKIFKHLIEKARKYETLLYISYSTNSNALISKIFSELIKKDNIHIFFEISRKLNKFISKDKMKILDHFFSVECIRATKIYEYIKQKNLKNYNLESLNIIKKCIEYYEIETVVPSIIQFLSGETKSESEIINQLNELEKSSSNKSELRKLEIYNYIKSVIIKLNKDSRSKNIVQELIKHFKVDQNSAVS